MKLSSSTWGEEEREAAKKVIDSGFTTMGPMVERFEREYAAFCGSRYCVMVNSGSSANLLMAAAYTLRYGSGVVAVPAIGWATSYSPFQQYGWKLRFVDVDQSCNYDLVKLWGSNEDYEVDLILGVNLLGSSNEYRGFPRCARVLEDNCESMGGEYCNRMTGTFGLMSSHSTYFSHHICTMEGGMVTTDDEHFYHMLLSLRSHGWTRHLPEGNKLNAKKEAWRFILPGYNVRPLEIQAAIGLEQMKKLPGILKTRRDNAVRFPLPKQREIGSSSWYGFCVTSEDPERLKSQLDERGVEYRPVISGNFTRHPVIEHFEYEASEMPMADYIHDHGVMIGNYGHPVDWRALEGIRV